MHFAKQNFVSLFKEIFISIQFFAFHTDIVNINYALVMSLVSFWYIFPPKKVY